MVAVQNQFLSLCIFGHHLFTALMHSKDRLLPGTDGLWDRLFVKDDVLPIALRSVTKFRTSAV